MYLAIFIYISNFFFKRCQKVFREIWKKRTLVTATFDYLEIVYRSRHVRVSKDPIGFECSKGWDFLSRSQVGG